VAKAVTPELMFIWKKLALFHPAADKIADAVRSAPELDTVAINFLDAP
jgi:hypothetical protein